MKVIINGPAKEIAALVLEIQEQQEYREAVSKTLSWVVNSLKNGTAGPTPKESETLSRLY